MTAQYLVMLINGDLLWVI